MTSQEEQILAIRGIQAKIERLQGRREEALPPNVKPVVEAARETHLVTLQLTLETAKLVQATQTLTEVLGEALKGIKSEISRLGSVLDTFGFAPITSQVPSGELDPPSLR